MANDVIFLPMEEYNEYSADGEEVPVGLKLCIQMSEQGKANGMFKLEINGAIELEAEIPASTLAQFGGSQSYRLVFKIPASEVKMSPNSFCGAWEDLEDRYT